MIRMVKTILSDGSDVWGIRLPEGEVLDCIDERRAYALAREITVATNLLLDPVLEEGRA
jgi:hypothetical protein